MTDQHEKDEKDPKASQTGDPAAGGTQAGEQEGGERKFTQTEVNAILGDRLTRERQRYADYDELRAKASKWSELEEEQKSELQRAQDGLAEMERQRDAALQVANDRAIRAAFVAESAKAGCLYPEDVHRLADLSGVSIAEGGEVEGVAEAVKGLIEAGRLVMGRPAAPGLDAGAGSGRRAGEKPTPLTADELSIAQKMGISPELYAKSKKTSGKER